MNTLYITESGRVMVTEDGKCSSKFSDRTSIDDVVLIEEDTHIIYQRGEKYFEGDAKAGDLVITFYTDDFPNRLIVVNSDSWKENILAARAEEQRRKEEWAAAKKCNDCKTATEPNEEAAPCCGDACECPA